MGSGPYRVHRISLINVSCYLIYREGEAILVDCGNKGADVKILREMEELGLTPGMLRLLILTHVHFDHAGSAASLKSATGCRIMVHRIEADRLRKGSTPIPGATRWKARLLVALGRIFRPGIMQFPGVDPDVLVDETASLEPYGFRGEVLHTPGHTPGSMVVLLEGGELIAGDTLFGVEGKQHFPPFAEDLPSLLRSWELIRSLPVKEIYPAHGKSFSYNAFMEEFGGAVKRYGSS
jgi:glyoxylase-like metal-dependent hydrolase (beta-lactamase superfamily II)